MSPATAQPATSTDQIDRCLQELKEAQPKLAKTSVRRRMKLVEACAEGVIDVAREWVEAACTAKAIPAKSPGRAEEILAGPVTTLRCLRLLASALQDIEQTGSPQLPDRPLEGPDERTRVPIFPSGRLLDALVFLGFKATAWMQEGVRGGAVQRRMAAYYQNTERQDAKTVVVLGAGNVSSIPVTDTLDKLFHEGRVVLLKMNPVNQILGPLFERALKPLISAGFLRIVYGGAQAGKAAVEHPLTDEIHITGSIDSFERIVWGPEGSERERRKRENDPVLDKPITGELGNVSPWIFVPGRYTQRQLKFQAENIATSVVNNASFNCVATKVLITWRGWDDRSTLLDLIDEKFKQVPPRAAYYPGAKERYERFTGKDPREELYDTLPWTLLRNVDPDASPHFLQEESFVCVLAEVQLDAESPEAFLRKAVQFANDRLAGTLCAAVTVPKGFRWKADSAELLQECLNDLQYGALGVNHWPGLAYAMMTPPWGGYPGSTLADAKSGIGWVHNAFMLDGVEKSVLEGPLTVFPKPAWFPTHANGENVAWRLFNLYRKPSWFNLARTLIASLRA